MIKKILNVQNKIHNQNEGTNRKKCQQLKFKKKKKVMEDGDERNSNLRHNYKC